MGGKSRYLAHDELAVCEVRRHPVVLLTPALQALGVVAGAALIGSLLSPGEGNDPLDTALGLIALAFVLRLGWKAWNWAVTRIVVTDRRILEVRGVLSRSVGSMPLGKVTDMTYHRSLLGRLLGYGAFQVESPGQKQAVDMIDHIPRPDAFYQTVTTLVMAGGGPAAAPVELPDRGPGEDAEPGPEEPPDDEPPDEDTGPLPRVIVLDP